MNEDILPEQINKKQKTKESEEDHAAADHTAEVTGPPLPSSLQMENIDDVVYSGTLGEDNTSNMVLWMIILKCWLFQFNSKRYWWF